MRSIFLSAVAATVLAVPAAAEITLPHIIGSNMVLQQQSDAALWGKATPGAKVTVTASWLPNGTSVSASADSEGRWSVALPTGQASYTPQTVTISGDGSDIVLENVLLGEVWLATGQSNMEMPLRGFTSQPIEGAGEAIAYSGRYPGIRFASVPLTGSYTQQEDTDVQWVTSCPANAGGFSAQAYFFARYLTDLIDVPVGIISCAYGGTRLESWLPEEILAGYPDEDMPAEQSGAKKVDEWHRVGVRYNAMISPVVPYTITGVIWNQGESNTTPEGIKTYAARQADMVRNFRTIWNNPDMPFYSTELPPWDYGDADASSAAFFREVQHDAAALTPRSAIVCTSDLVYPHEIDDVHGSRKREIGERMAWLAAADMYGVKGLPVDYPRFVSMDVDGEKATLHFSGADNGFTPNGYLSGFEACGSDGVWHPATAREDVGARDIVVTCHEAGQIKEVRYNYKNFIIGRIHNHLGLPLVPFRSSHPTPRPSSFK